MSYERVVPPEIDELQVHRLLEEYYDFLPGRIELITKLNGYDDKNYKVVTSVCKSATEQANESYVLKVFNLQDSAKRAMIDAQNDLLFFLEKHGIKCPIPIRNKFGSYYGEVDLQSGRHAFKLTAFFDGVLLSQITQFITDELCHQLGKFVAKMDNVLEKFVNQSYITHTTAWSLNEVPKLRAVLQFLRENEAEISSETRLQTKIIDEFALLIEEFEENVLQRRAQFRPGIVHGDFNEQNVILLEDAAPGEEHISPKFKIEAVLDFGDTHHSYRVFDVAISLTYLLLTTLQLDNARHFLAGYEEEAPLNEHETSVIVDCILARIAQSVILGTYASHFQPQNASYIQISRRNALKLWELLRAKHKTELIHLWTKT